MLTSDTHFPDGHLSDTTPQSYDNQYSNVIVHSSQQVAAFVSWCQQQLFYENTTIIISGDHLTMDQNYISKLPKNYNRTVFNLVINAPIKPAQNKNRQFSTVDMFPTTLASLGIKIPTNSLGIGTNLFSERETILEKYSIEGIHEELGKQSEFYNQNILKITTKSKSASSSTKKEAPETEKEPAASTTENSKESTIPPSASVANTEFSTETLAEEQISQEND